MSTIKRMHDVPRIAYCGITAKEFALLVEPCHGSSERALINLTASYDRCQTVPRELRPASVQPHSGVEGEAPVALPLEGATRAPVQSGIGIDSTTKI